MRQLAKFLSATGRRLRTLCRIAGDFARKASSA